jgi:TonB family protein
MRACASPGERDRNCGYKSTHGGLGLSEEPQTDASRRAAGNTGARAALRVVPDPDSPRGRAEALAAAWAGDAEQADWCVDAEPALAAGCSQSDSGVCAMPASERRAIHLTRQRIRAQAILATTEPDQQRREQRRRLAIVIGSAVLHAIGFVVLATAVADLQPKQRPATHEHLFEARAVVPFEPAPAVPAPLEVVDPQPVEQAQPVVQAQPKRAKPTHDHAADPTPAQPSQPAAYELRGFELSSDGELAAGEPGGESWGRPGGKGTGSGSAGTGHHDHDHDQPRATAKPDKEASPSGGLLQPEYPPELERKGIEGSVIVKVWIDEHGHVIKAEVVESSHEESFDHNALMAAQRQEWSPAIRGGEPVASTRRYRMNFRLRR